MTRSENLAHLNESEGTSSATRMTEHAGGAAGIFGLNPPIAQRLALARDRLAASFESTPPQLVLDDLEGVTRQGRRLARLFHRTQQQLSGRHRFVEDAGRKRLGSTHILAEQYQLARDLRMEFAADHLERRGRIRNADADLGQPNLH